MKKSFDAESARGVSPRAAHRSGLDTLASSGSCHRTKAAASRRELELLLLPVGSLPTAMTCPLRSTSITPASTLLQGSPPLSGASVLSASRLEPLAPFPLASPARFSRSGAAYMPDAAWAVSVHPPSSSREMGQPPVLASSNRISTLLQRFACARLSQSCLPGSLSRRFRDAHHHGF